MKRTVIAAVAMCLLPSMGRAEGMSAPEASEKTIVADSVQEQIRKELETIRALQVDISKKREDAVRAKLRLDSLQHKNPDHDLSTDYGVMAQIEDNTHKDNLRDGWNVYGIVALIVALVSLVVGIKTFTSQSGTEKNTKKLSQDAQRDLLNDMLRHLYRNFVITYAMRTKMKDIDYAGHPSEEHFEKLKVPMENIHLEVFYGEDEKFGLMHILYLNLRNYNEEIEVARQHICDSTLTRDTKEEDFNLLEFKVGFLTEKIVDTIIKIWGKPDKSPQKKTDDETILDKETRKKEKKIKREKIRKENADLIIATQKAMKRSLDGDTNAKYNIDVPGSEKFEPADADNLDFYDCIYDEDELKTVLDAFNRDVREERKKNEREAWKIRMIRF